MRAWHIIAAFVLGFTLALIWDDQMLKMAGTSWYVLHQAELSRHAVEQ